MRIRGNLPALRGIEATRVFTALALAFSLTASAAPQCVVHPARNVCSAPTLPARTEARGAPSALDTLGRGTWVVDEEHDELVLVTPYGPSRRFPVGRWPQQVVVESSGRVFVSCRQGGRVDIIDPELVQRFVEVGEEPRALALDEDGQRLYVGLVTANAIVALDTRSLRPAARVEVPDSPHALALTAGGLAVASMRSPVIRFFDRSLREPPTEIILPAARTATLSPRLLVPAGDGVLLIAERARTGLDQPVSFGGYGGEQGEPFDTVVFSIRSLDRGYAPARQLVELIAPEPTSAILSNGVLFIASRGRGSVVALGISPELDALSSSAELMPRPRVVSTERELRRFTNLDGLPMTYDLDLASIAAGEDGELVMNDVLNRRLLRARLTPALTRMFGRRGPSRVFDVRQRVRIDQPFFTEQLDLAAVSTPMPEGADAELRVGAHLFHTTTDFRITNRAMSCASCHPDGREDGRVWQLTGTRRQTPMLTGRLHETAPFNWLGTAKTLKANLETTILDRLEGEGLQPRELNALSRFISEGLRPVTMPAPKEPELVALGEQVFNDSAVGCATCHPADLATTDGERHDVGTLSTQERREFRAAHAQRLFSRRHILPIHPVELPLGLPEKDQRVALPEGTVQRIQSVIRRPPIPPAPRRFDTPSLKSIALTAPYFHDGAVASLEQLITDNRDRMGTTSHLTPLEQRALVAYLQTL